MPLYCFVADGRLLISQSETETWEEKLETRGSVRSRYPPWPPIAFDQRTTLCSLAVDLREHSLISVKECQRPPLQMLKVCFLIFTTQSNIVTFIFNSIHHSFFFLQCLRLVPYDWMLPRLEQSRK